MIETVPIISKDFWEKLRREDVTASVAGCLLGVHDFMTPYRLYAEKTGKIVDTVEASPQLERGILLEPVALKLYQQKYPVVHVSWNGTPGEIDGIYLRDPDKRIGATIDASAFDEDKGGLGIIQFKTVEAGVFRRKWRANDDDPTPAVPLYIAVQAIIEAYLAGAKWAQVAAMVVSHGIDLHVIDVPLHEGVFNQVCAKVKDFWRRVEANDPLPPDYAEDGLTISRMYDEKPDSKFLDLTGDNHLPVILAEREQLLFDGKMIDDRLDAIKSELRFKVGNHGGLITKGYKVKRLLVNVKEHLVPASHHFRITISNVGEDKK